jgi:hypothetical protein
MILIPDFLLPLAGPERNPAPNSRLLHRERTSLRCGQTPQSGEEREGGVKEDPLSHKEEQSSLSFKAPLYLFSQA